MTTVSERANSWTTAARPIVRALLALRDTERDLLESCDAATWDKVRPAIADHEYRLRAMLDDMRDTAISAHLPKHPASYASEREWTAYEEASATAHLDTITVQALIREMEEEA